jgi:uncharacterized protein YbcV (DUF1398 family)
MFTVEQIHAAHSYVKFGADFPAYIRAIKVLGVVSFVTWVADSHTDYVGADHYQTSSAPMYAPLEIAPSPDAKAFEDYLRMHQQGQTDYSTFCKHCAETGVEKWIVDLDAMTCTYFDRAGQLVLVEPIPQ